MITPYAKNAKKHPDSQIELLAKSIKEFGWQQPIKVGKDNVIIVGHGRWEAFKRFGEGMKAPWIINEAGETISGGPETKKLTLAQEKAYRLIDNKLNESDWELELAIGDLRDLPDYLRDISGFSEETLAGVDDFGEDFSLADGEKGGLEQITFTLTAEQAELVHRALDMVKKDGEYNYTGEDGNQNAFGLALILEQWITSK